MRQAFAAGGVQLTVECRPRQRLLSHRANGGGRCRLREIASGVTNLYFTDNTVHGSTTYVYQIRAENSTETGPCNGVALATTPQAVAPTAPSGLSLASASSVQISLNWTASERHRDQLSPGAEGRTILIMSNRRQHFRHQLLGYARTSRRLLQLSCCAKMPGQYPITATC